MFIKKTTQIGSPILRTQAREVHDFKSSIVGKTITDLVATMRATNLVGMAAPQIGTGLRIFVSEIRKTKYRKDLVSEKLRVFVNPIITKQSKKVASGYEGCGSVAHAGLFGPVQRHTSIEVTARDRNGTPFTIKAKGMLARIIEHEIDHLNGVLFIDKVKTTELLDRDIYLKNKSKGRK